MTLLNLRAPVTLSRAIVFIIVIVFFWRPKLFPIKRVRFGTAACFHTVDSRTAGGQFDQPSARQPLNQRIKRDLVICLQSLNQHIERDLFLISLWRDLETDSLIRDYHQKHLILHSSCLLASGFKLWGLLRKTITTRTFFFIT